MYFRFESRSVISARSPENPAVAPAPWTWRDHEAGSPCLFRVGTRLLLFVRGQTGGRDHLGLFAVDSGRSGWHSTSELSGNPAIVPGPPGTWDALAVRSPSVAAAGQMLVCFYEGVDEGGTSCVGAALSVDGILWTKYPGNPLTHGRAPSVILHRDTWLMASEIGDGVVACTSTNGVTWGTPQAIYLQGIDFGAPKLWADGNSTWMMLAQRGPRPCVRVAAMSGYPYHWKLSPGIPLAPGGDAAWDGGGVLPGSLAWTRDGLLLAYEGWGRGYRGPAPGPSPHPASVGFALLTNGLPILTSP